MIIFAALCILNTHVVTRGSVCVNHLPEPLSDLSQCYVTFVFVKWVTPQWALVWCDIYPLPSLFISTSLPELLHCFFISYAHFNVTENIRCDIKAYADTSVRSLFRTEDFRELIAKSRCLKKIPLEKPCEYEYCMISAADDYSH